eukprot:GHVU01204272.1.p1 GENE.GHVU01204272.1~~GHVU01204272.1.p1  ORF type:complete len:146 (+),score=29.96 GHVU01204272.1:468-905(+)
MWSDVSEIYSERDFDDMDRELHGDIPQIARSTESNDGGEVEEHVRDGEEDAGDGEEGADNNEEDDQNIERGSGETTNLAIELPNPFDETFYDLDDDDLHEQLSGSDISWFISVLAVITECQEGVQELQGGLVCLPRHPQRGHRLV